MKENMERRNGVSLRQPKLQVTRGRRESGVGEVAFIKMPCQLHSLYREFELYRRRGWDREGRNGGNRGGRRSAKSCTVTRSLCACVTRETVLKRTEE